MLKNQSLKITLFYCSNSITADEISYCSTKLEGIELNLISLPCSGKVSQQYLLKTIETGSDGSILLTCRFGECKFIQGNFRAQKRVDAVDDLIFESGLNRSLVKCIQIEGINKAEFIVEAINNYSKQLRKEVEVLKEA
jgi:coenzyme F420-reducing hydrogenase delta subunit